MNAIEIIPNLWLGDAVTSNDLNFLATNNIKNILQIMPKEHVFPHIRYLIIPVQDSDLCDRRDTNLFRVTNNFILDSLSKNQGILIHCKRGHHRSATVVAAFLTKYYGMSLCDAINYIRIRRPGSFTRKTCIMSSLDLQI